MTPSQDAVATASVDTVRAQLQLTAPGPQTLRYLRAVLGLGYQDVCDTKPLRAPAKKAVQAKGSAISRPPVRATTQHRQKPGATFQIHDSNDDQLPSLLPTDRVKIATEAFNLTLKNLGEAIRMQKGNQESNPTTKTPLHLPQPDQALQERSLNRESKSAATSSKNISQCSTLSDWELVAECSHSALQCLRKYGTGAAGSGSGKNVSLENAALVLLDRSITLNLAKQAVRQLFDIHRIYWGGHFNENSSSKFNIAELLLGRPDAADDNSRFGFIASMQSQALRLALLLGPKCISPELLKSLQPDTAGSPAWITIQGVRKGWHKSDQAGLQLRTISLAISKLHALASKSKTGKPPPNVLFDLFCLSLCIKFESWVNLGHKPEPAIDVWRPFHNAIKHFSTNTNDLKMSSTHILRSFKSFRELLQVTKCKSDIPLELTEILLHTLQGSEDYPEFLTLAEESSPTSKDSHLILQCQITIARLKSSSCNVPRTLSSVRCMERALAEAKALSQANLDRLLLHLAQLRKAATEFISPGEAQQPISGQEGILEDLQKSLVCLTCSTFRFLRRHMAVALTWASEPSRRKNEKAFLVTLMKTVDAVVSMEHCAVTQISGLAQTAWETLKYCSAAVQQLQTEYIPALTQSSLELQCNHLRIRISQAFWSRYLAAIKQGEPILEQAVIIELSVQGLFELPLSDQRAAYTALKYERLASCYLEVHNLEMAMTALRKSIATSIRQGILSTVAESLLSNSFYCAWSEQDSSCKAFGKVLVTYAKTLLAHASSDGLHICFYDDQALPAIHRAVLIEKQLSAMLEVEIGRPQLSLCASIVELLLQLLRHPKYQVFMLRLINHLLQIGLKKRMPISTFPVDSAFVQNLLCMEVEAKETVFLQKFEPELRSLLVLQHGFFTGLINNQQLEQAVKQLSDTVQPCRELKQAQMVCDDVRALIAPLLLAVDYAGLVEEDGTALMALEALQHLIYLGIDAPGLCRTNVLIRKASIHLRQQDVQSAEICLATIDKTLGDDKINPVVEVEFALAYSEYYLQVQSLDGCFGWLRQAQNAWECQNRSDKSSSIKTKLKDQTLFCRAAYLASRLAYQQNRLLDAIVLARQAAKIAASIWCSIEKLWTSATPSQLSGIVDVELHNVSIEFSRLELSGQTMPRVTASTISQASYVALCCTVFGHMASLIAHCGIYQDAAAFREQALKLAKRTRQATPEAVTLSELSVLHARAGQTEKARDGLRELHQIATQYTSDWLQALICVNRGETYLILGDLTAASQCLIEAKYHQASNIPRTDKPPVGQIRKCKTIKSTAKTPVRQRGNKQQKDKELNDPVTPCVLSSTSTLELRGVEARISALEARYRSLEDNANATTAFGTASDSNTRENGRKSISLAFGLVQSALKLFSEDALHNVLAETAVALPVRYQSARKSGRVSFVQAAASEAPVNAKDRKQRLNQRQAEKETLKDGSALLLQAYDILQRMNDFQPNRLSSDIVHTCHKILTQITLLSAGLNRPLANSSLNLVLDITRPLDLARQRGNFVTLGELNASRQTSIQEWPSADGIGGNGMSLSSDLTVNYDVNLPPASWSIVCLELNEDRNELFVARLTRERSPFVVRIPLARPDPSEGGNDEFDLKWAKTEMQEIILRANSTAHDSRGSSADKLVRGAWYAERQALDQQLATLLDNIENVWVGGFRGLLCTSRVDESGLSKFGQSLSLTLSRHLPSRQRTSRLRDSTIELHDHVLELFVGLGHPGDVELEDAVTDLLYFVIDILQFNGERNAYDEIDFDAMLVEVLEALHAYHDAKSVSQEERGHMILVLDKELQVFPWESLPCLRGRAVSRMASLGSIWDWLGTVSEQSHDLAGYLISRTNGAYILNPSSDLKSTQETFSRLFEDQLPGYKAIVNRPPGADEMETALKEHDLMLYFGHGGGGQYIRPRTIRKMDKCAVTLLMGCSSAKLTECGVYEPYGMPLSYLSGGSSAVVGTLWDVTDRDIDRFALELMEDWGLLKGSDGSGTQAVKKPSKRKAGKMKDASRLACERQKRGPVSLDQAVADARDACLLKYLNGAAPVMYGIPVFLD